MPGVQHPYQTDPAYHEDRAEGLLASVRDATPTALAAFAAHAGPGAPHDLATAREVVAAEHGCADWAAFTARLAALEAEPDGFLRAFRLIEGHAPGPLAALLDAEPGLVAVRGTNGNDLLGMAGATCDERLVAVLLEHGADPNTANVHGWTPLHQAGYGNLTAIAELLLAAGARTDTFARGDGGTPLVVALFWGNTTMAELLAARDRAPGNLRVAAGLGDAETITALLGTPAAGAHRGFYRPHGGFPEWTPSDDPQEALDEALAWAARSDRADVLSALVDGGARLEADVYRGTALAWAAACGRVGAIKRLVALGADPSGRTSFGGPEHGVATTPLHLAAQNGDLPAIGALLAAGADPTLEDGFYTSTPAGWAEHDGHPEAAALLGG